MNSHDVKRLVAAKWFQIAPLIACLLPLAACNVNPPGVPFSPGEVSFWEQRPLTDPDITRLPATGRAFIGLLRTIGPRVLLDGVAVDGPLNFPNGANLVTGENSWARVDFITGVRGCTIDILNLRRGEGYGETGPCKHSVLTRHADVRGRTGGAYHVQADGRKTVVTLYRGAADVAARTGDGNFVAVTSGTEVVVEDGIVRGPNPLSAAELRERIGWRQRFAAPRQVAVLNVFNFERAQAARALDNIGLRAEFTGSGPRVVAQNPSANTYVPQDFAVQLRLGQGRPEPSVELLRTPDVIGQRVDRARRRLDALGLETRTVGRGTTVARQNPPPGTRIRRGAAVRLALEDETLTVPRVTGMSVREARNRLREAGFRNIDVRGTGSVVTEQQPRAGRRVAAGHAVRLIAERQQTVERVVVPNVTGRRYKDALAALRRNGLDPGRISRSNRNADWVSGQNPRAGTRVPAGSRIDLRLIETLY